MIYLALSLLLEIAADVLFKIWAEAGNRLMWAGGATAYIGSIFLFAFALKSVTFTIAIVLYSVINLIAILLIGRFIFGDSLNTYQMVGVGLGLIAVALLTIE